MPRLISSPVRVRCPARSALLAARVSGDGIAESAGGRSGPHPVEPLSFVAHHLRASLDLLVHAVFVEGFIVGAGVVFSSGQGFHLPSRVARVWRVFRLVLCRSCSLSFARVPSAQRDVGFSLRVQ